MVGTRSRINTNMKHYITKSCHSAAIPPVPNPSRHKFPHQEQLKCEGRIFASASHLDGYSTVVIWGSPSLENSPELEVPNAVNDWPMIVWICKCIFHSNMKIIFMWLILLKAKQTKAESCASWERSSKTTGSSIILVRHVIYQHHENGIVDWIQMVQ